MTDIAIAPDLAAIKQRQQATWASGGRADDGTMVVPSEYLEAIIVKR
jgi:hypothetical protein